jgi:chromosomal replication initiation ATPase DnaA
MPSIRPKSAEPRRPRDEHDRHAAQLAAAIVSYAVGVDHSDVLAPGRGAQDRAAARQLAMYLTHVTFSMSLARVANAFGRDRSTVAHACAVAELLRDDPAVDDWLDTLEAALNAAPEFAASPRPMGHAR